MDHLEYCDRLGVAVDDFATALDGADLTITVPTCPKWTVADLVVHLGQIHRWAEALVRELAPERIKTGRHATPDDDLVAWLREGGDALVATLRAADPDAPMWSWAGDHHVRFWSRRQLHETSIHQADAFLALGLPIAFDAAVAADSIDELLDVLPSAAYFAPDVSGLSGNGETIHLHATDTPDAPGIGEWLITLRSDGYDYAHGHAKGDVAVRAALSDLDLLMWNRVPLADDRFEVFGDTALLERWLASAAL